MSDEKYKQRIAEALNPFMKDGTPQNNLMKNLLNPKYVLTDKEVEMKFQLDKILERAVNHFKLQNEVKNLSEKVFASEKNGTFDEKTFVENILNSKMIKGGKSRRKKRRTKRSKKRRGKRTRKQHGGMVPDEPEECPVCLEPYDDVRVAVFPYKCVVHSVCSVCYNRGVPICPLCRAIKVILGINGVQTANRNLQYSNDGIARIHPNEMVYDLPHVQGFKLVNQQLDSYGYQVNGQYRRIYGAPRGEDDPPSSEDLIPRHSDHREGIRFAMVMFFVMFSVVVSFILR
jgi:hypothetical protein